MAEHYISLHNYSSFSIMRGLSKPLALFERAKELGQMSLAITDYTTMAGMWDALKASKQTGVKLIAGCEMNFVDNVAKTDSPLRTLVFLAKNATGYKNLLTLNKFGYDNFIVAFKKATPRIDWPLLERYKEGLICITGGGNGLIAQHIMSNDLTQAKEDTKKLIDIFGDNFALELQPNDLKRRETPYGGAIDQNLINRQMRKIGLELGCKCIVATGSLYSIKEEHRAHDVLLAIGSGQPLRSQNRITYNVNDFYLKNAEETEAYFTRHAGYWSEDFIKSLFDNTKYFDELCEFPDWIDPKFSNPSGKELPEFPVKDQADYKEFLKWKNDYFQKDLPEDVLYLRYRCEIGFAKKVPQGKEAEYRERLKEELDVLNYCGVSSYMLIVADYVEWARNNGISVGPGRGCLSGNSLVLTATGFKQLSEIDKTDEVYTHTGTLNRVLNIFEYDIDENGIEIVSDYAASPIHLTSDHKVLANIRSETDEYKRRELSRHSLKRWNNDSNIVWTPASNLKPGDRIFMPIPERNIKSPPIIDLAKFADSNCKICDDAIICAIPKTNEFSLRWIARETKLSRNAVKNAKNNPSICVSKTLTVIDEYLNSHGSNLEVWQCDHNNYQKTLKRFIVPDNEFFYFLGRWVGDGWILHCASGGYIIGFAFHADDAVGIRRIDSYMRELGLDTYHNVSKTKKLVQITAHSKVIFDLFCSLFPDYVQSSYTKHLPLGFRLLDDSKLQSLLGGCFGSDGHLEINKNCNRNNYDTTSYRLALEIKEILLYLGKPSSINTRPPFIAHGYNCKESYKLRWTNNEKTYDEGYLCPIRQLNTVRLQKVYDITTDNHSYLTSNFAVHNSVGGSLVGYLLGIHSADPIKYSLVFPRFHNKLKTSYSDIDLDFSTAGRDKVKDYIRQKYGDANAAHVSNVNTITPKVYVRDISRTFEFSDGKMDAVKIGNDIADTIPSEFSKVTSALEGAPLFAEYAKQYPELAEFAKTIGGKARAWSTHAAGLIISKRPLSDIVPVRRDKDGFLALEYDKDRAEENGLVKMDLLALSTLDIIDQTNAMIKMRGGMAPYIDCEVFDQKTYDLISNGNTLCVFQFGTSSGTISLCKRFKATTLEDLALITTLARPNAAEIRDDFFEVKEGKKERILLHPKLYRAFKDTYGFSLYDESLLILAEDIAGWDLGEADRLRKLTKEKGKNPEKAKAWKKDFIENAKIRNNMDGKLAAKIWTDIVEPFQKYSFNKSHALLYSMISYQTAYLKAHYPLEFLVANLKSEVNSNAPAAKENILRIKDEIRALGVRIVNPDINTSDSVYKIIDDKTIMTGLNSMKYMGTDALPDIIEKRPFKSLDDFLERVDGKKVRAPAIQALAASGALDSFGINRKLIFYYASDYKKKFGVYLKKPVSKRGDFNYPWPEEAQWNPKECYALEKYYLGEGISGTVYDRYDKFFDKKVVSFSDLPKAFKYKQPIDDDIKENRKRNTFYCNFGNPIPGLKGIVTNVFSFKVKKEDSKIRGEIMARMTVQDPFGNELTILAFPEAWKNAQERIEKELSAGKHKFEAGIAIYFTGNFQYENEYNYIFILSDIIDYKEEPGLPADLKSRKVKMPRSKSIKEEIENVENLNEKELIEVLEDKMTDEGYSFEDEDSDDPFDI